MKTLEERVATLEDELAMLKLKRLSPPVRKDWRSTVGWAKGLDLHEAADKAGAEYRRDQTYEKEIEARGGVGY